VVDGIKLWKQNRSERKLHFWLIAASFGTGEVDIIKPFSQKTFGLEVLMEVHDGERIGSKPFVMQLDLVGVNNRNLKLSKYPFDFQWIWSIEFLLTL